MDNTTWMVVIGLAAVAVIVVIVITIVIAVVQKSGQSRRTTASFIVHDQRSSRRGTFEPPPSREPIQPPVPIPSPTWISPRPGDGTPVVRTNPAPSNPTPPPHSSRKPMTKPMSQPISKPPSAPPVLSPVAKRLRQEVEKLRDSDYQQVVLGYSSDDEEYCIQVRVAVQNRNVSIHLVCTNDYPLSPPYLVVTTDSNGEFDNYGQIAEQRMLVGSKMIDQWTPSNNIVAVVNELMQSLPGATIEDKKFDVPFFQAYVKNTLC